MCKYKCKNTEKRGTKSYIAFQQYSAAKITVQRPIYVFLLEKRGQQYTYVLVLYIIA